MERCILVHVHFQCIRVTCCISLQCNAFHKVAFCCIQGLKHIRLHSVAFITRCILVVMHSYAFRMILHAAQGLHLVLVRYKYIRVHSCAFIYIHMVKRRSMTRTFASGDRYQNRSTQDTSASHSCRHCTMTTCLSLPVSARCRSCVLRARAIESNDMRQPCTRQSICV
jgi:hypothetical protein